MIHKSVEYVSSGHWSCSGPTKPSQVPHGGSRKYVDDDDLSVWVIVVLSVLGVITLLGFFALLFCLIYKIYTHEPVCQAPETRYSAANREEVVMKVVIPQNGNAAKAPPTAPPAYDNVKSIES